MGRLPKKNWGRFCVWRRLWRPRPGRRQGGGPQTPLHLSQLVGRRAHAGLELVNKFMNFERDYLLPSRSSDGFGYRPKPPHSRRRLHLLKDDLSATS